MQNKQLSSKHRPLKFHNRNNFYATLFSVLATKNITKVASMWNDETDIKLSLTYAWATAFMSTCQYTQSCLLLANTTYNILLKFRSSQHHIPRSSHAYSRRLLKSRSRKLLLFKSLTNHAENQVYLWEVHGHKCYLLYHTSSINR